MIPTLNGTYTDLVKQHTNNKEQLSRKKYKNALKNIQWHTVHNQVNKYNKPLGTTPRKIAEE